MALLTNIQAYWPLDGSSIDRVNGNNGTDTSVTYSTANAKLNIGGGFNGTTSKVALGNAFPFSFGSGNFTISAWFKTTATVRQTIIHKSDFVGNGGTTQIGYLIDTLSTGFLRFVVATNGSNYAFIDSSAALNDGNWHHAVASRTGTNTLRLYIDGVSVGTTNLTGTVGTLNNNIGLDIGREWDVNASTNYTAFFNGSIDEVGLWNIAISTTDIATLYKSGYGIPYPFISGLYKFFL